MKKAEKATEDIESAAFDLFATPAEKAEQYAADTKGRRRYRSTIMQNNMTAEQKEEKTDEIIRNSKKRRKIWQIEIQDIQ
jgi:hypothetical protein